MGRERRRVAVTGLGLVTSLGHDVDTFWRAVACGRSGVSEIERFDAGGLPVRIAAEVKDFDPDPYIERKDSRLMDRFAQFAVVASLRALADAGLEVRRDIEPERVGVVISSALGGQATAEEQTVVLHRDGLRQMNPYYVPMMLVNMAPAQVSISTGATGPTTAVVTACAGGAHAIGHGARLVRRGEADVVLAGGAEAPVFALNLAGLCALGVLSTRNREPQLASRPFDRDRGGMVLGEGAAVLVLEERGRARARGARIYAELAGYGATADAHHSTAPDPSGAGAAACMRRALCDAGALPADVDLLHANGIATGPGDVSEARAVRTAFGEHASRLPCSSTTSMTGHLLGAAGALGALAAVMAVRDGLAPPTVNLDHPDPECDLDHVAGGARRLDVDTAMSNAFGFGGHNASLVFRRHRPASDG